MGTLGELPTQTDALGVTPTPWLQSLRVTREGRLVRWELMKQRHRRDFFLARGIIFFSNRFYLFIIQTRKVKKGEETETPAEVD